MVSFLIKNISMGEDSFSILLGTLERRLEERRCMVVTDEATFVDYTFTFDVDERLANDKYIIEVKGKCIEFTAANDCALHAAAGRFLLDSSFDGLGGFVPAALRVEHTPEKPLRGMYFATHFHNFYHNAPLEKVYEVIEDLALRGCNAVLVWYDMHHFESIDCESSRQLINRLKAFMAYAKRIGMKASMTMLANEGFSSSPQELRASFLAENGYHSQPVGRFECEICPSAEGGMDEIIRERKEMLEAFADVSPDLICIWPYDQGGCTCKACTPWGANGYLRILPEFKKLVKQIMPNTELILSTWDFDCFITGEWDAFYEKLIGGEVVEFDYILSYFLNGNLPECIKKHGIPEGVKFIDFPEISMNSCDPWGGFGGSVLGSVIECTNKNSGHLYSGGFPYSEGIYEDINKFIQLSYYTDGCVSSAEAIKRYAKFEFCCDAPELAEAIACTEKTLARKDENDGCSRRFIIENPEKIEYIYEIFQKYNDILPKNITSTKKWKVIYLRSVIDYELLNNDFKVGASKRCVEAMRELCDIYYATDETNPWVHPPVDKFENVKLIVAG